MDAHRAEVRALSATLRELVLAMEQRRTAIATELEIGISEVIALGHLHVAGTLTPSDLGRLMDLTSGSVTALLDRLEHGGFVLREPNPEDKRSLLVRATPAGRSAMHWVFEGFDATVASTLRDHPRLDLADMAAFVNALTAELRESEPETPDS